MKFFFPDSQDQIDPGFDFRTEERSALRVRQRDDLYAHEALGGQVLDGLLVSKAIVDGIPGATGKYTLAQRQRLYREGVRRFFRLDSGSGPPPLTMGDCGAFNYCPRGNPAVHARPGHRLLRRVRLRSGHLRRPRHPRLRSGRGSRLRAPAEGSAGRHDRASPWTWPRTSWPGAGQGMSGSSPLASPRAGALTPTPGLSANCSRSATRGSPLAAWSPSKHTRSSPL